MMAVAELSMHVVEGEGGPLLPVCVSVCASRVGILREHTHTTLGERTLAAEIGTSAEGGTGALHTARQVLSSPQHARRFCNAFRNVDAGTTLALYMGGLDYIPSRPLTVPPQRKRRALLQYKRRKYEVAGRSRRFRSE